MKTKKLFLTAVAAVCCMILSLSVTSCASDIADNPVDGPVVVPIVGQGEDFVCNFGSESGSYSLVFSITSEPTEEDPELPFEVCLTYCDGAENCNVDIPATVENDNNGQEYTVTAIGDRPFICGELMSVAIPASVKSIGKDAFRSCENLISVSFADNSQLENIGDDAFDHCSSLAAITIPASVTTIGKDAFGNCSSLSTVSFADNAQLEVIESNLFNSCTSLETITLPASVKTIGWWAFVDCTNLKTVYLNSDPEINGGFPDGVEVVYLNHDN